MLEGSLRGTNEMGSEGVEWLLWENTSGHVLLSVWELCCCFLFMWDVVILSMLHLIIPVPFPAYLTIIVPSFLPVVLHLMGFTRCFAQNFQKKKKKLK